jgi:V/A-type H+/Na+-transporting ATPase subunit D
MPIRVPPGKAGRLWLVARLAVAERGRDLLDRKRRALMVHAQRLSDEADAAERRFADTAAEAALWMGRARLAEGDSRLALLAAHVTGRPSLRIEWRRTMGVEMPEVVELRPAPVPDLAGLGAGTALLRSADAHRALVEAAAAHAATRTAADRVLAELGVVTRRVRALEQRWIPRQRAALQALELALDEADREEAARIRWLAERR